MSTEYEQHLLETIERQERELVKCREWMDSLRDSLDNVRKGCKKPQFKKEAMDDLQSMMALDMLEVMCDYIRENGKIIIEEEIKKMAEKYGK